MSGIIEEIAIAVAYTIADVIALFGGVFALAVALWFASQAIRREGVRAIGQRYYWCVCPGVVCHETGHALGCVFTGTRISKFVPFRPEGDTLGYVQYEIRPGKWPKIAMFFISTGPVWFGSAVILLLCRLAAGPELFPDFRALAPKAGDSLVVHVERIVAGAGHMFGTVCSPAHWRTPLVPVFAYLAFCIASEITLSPSDLKGMWRGLVAIICAIFVANRIPFISRGLGWCIDTARPVVFALETVLLLVLVADLLILGCVRLIRVIKRRHH